MATHLPLGILDAGTQNIQNAGYLVFWGLLSLVIVAVAIIIAIMAFKNSKYKKTVIIYDKVGDQQIMIPDKVKEVKIDDTILYYYKRLKKYSPKFDAKYETLYKQGGLFPKTLIGFSVFKYGDKIAPVLVKSNPGIVPIDYDAWNYLVQRLRLNAQKYQRNEQFMRMLPFMALGAVVLMFIIGNLLWGQHIEKVAIQILDSATTFAQAGLERSGAIQVIN